MSNTTLKIEYPFTIEKVSGLKVGQRVRVCGVVFTGRDRLHKHLFEGGKCPVGLEDGAIYHCGPVVLRNNNEWHVCAAGPTTSIREEPYMAALIERYHVRVILGKGGMGSATRQACKKFGCVYLQTVGGTAALIANAVTKVRAVHFMSEFGRAEALWELEVNDLEAVVTMDTRGRSMHERVRNASRRILSKALDTPAIAEPRLPPAVEG